VTPEPRTAADIASALGEIARALEVLRERVRQAETAAGPDVAAPEARPALPATGDVLAAVHEILSIPASGLQPGEIFTLATDRVARLLAADRVMLFVAQGERLVPRSGRGFRRDDLELIAVEAGQGLVGRVFKDNRPLGHEAGAEPAEDPFIERFPVKSAIAVPVRADDEVVGVLYAGRRAPGAFGPADILVLLVAAERMGAALIEQTLLDRRGAYIGRLAELTRFAGEIPVGRDVKEILARACEIGCRLLGVRAAAVAMGVDALEVVAARGLPQGADASRTLSAHEGLTAEVYAGDGPVACRDVQARRATERSFLGHPGLHGCLLLPLRLRGLLLGVLYLADTEVRGFSAEEVEVARLLAAMAAAAVENSQVHAKLAGAFEAARAAHERSAEAERGRVLGDVAGGLAREFNQILAIILGKSQLLLARALDEPVREGLGTIEEAAWRGADVMHRLGALASLAADDAMEAADLKALVQEAAATARTRGAGEAGGALEVAVEQRPVPLVRGSEPALREALANLVANAVDAMAAGGRLSLRLRPRDAGAELVVEDTGEGLDEAVRPRIFEPFFTTRAPARLGLGLTIARGIITRFGGSIDVASRAGGGVTATVWLPAAAPVVEVAAGRLPAAAPPAPLVSARGAVPEAPRAVGDRASILVLEDEEPVRQMLVDALTRAGHAVEAASDGTAGLAKLEGQRFDVVLADLALPQRSGLIIARSVKRLSPRTPVILITGWGHLLDPERLRDHGVDLMLVKPFRPERAVSVVGDALKLHVPA
jgi:signal transduction histidine kinase/putative methionine-R-sulfoxide reductase with GAF domain